MASRQAEAQRAGQEALAAAALPLLSRSWSLVDLQDLQGSLPRFRMAVQAVVEYYGRASAAAAVEWFRQERRAAGVVGRVSLKAVPATPEGFVDSLVADSVAALLVTPETAPDVLDSQAQHLILQQGRNQMLSASAQDAAAKGWARVPNPDACSFCLMLAARGAVYGSKRAANFRAHFKQPNGSGGDCRCTVEPLFRNHYEPTAVVRNAQALWADSTKGRSGKDARDAFRQAVEGRPVTGSTTKGTPRKGRTPAHTHNAPQGRTAETQAAQLKVLEAMPPAKTPEAAAWRVVRIAEIRKFLGS